MCTFINNTLIYSTCRHLFTNRCSVHYIHIALLELNDSSELWMSLSHTVMVYIGNFKLQMNQNKTFCHKDLHKILKSYSQYIRMSVSPVMYFKALAFIAFDIVMQ